MKKILFFQPTLNTNGGIDRLTSTLSMELQETYECLFLTAYPLETSFEVPGTPFSFNEKETQGTFDRILKVFSRARQLARFYREHSIDTVIVSADGCIVSALLAKLFWRNDMRVISFMHQEIRKSSFPNRVALRTLLGYSDRVVGVSKGITGSLVKSVEEKKLECIYNSTSVVVNTAESLKEFEVKEDSVFFEKESTTFVSIGRLAYEKAQWRLIEAFAEFSSSMPNAQLLIIGEGPERPLLERRITELHMENIIFLLGVRSNVYPYLCRARALVLSSFSESFGLAIVEALSLGIPVIAPDCDFGPREILLGAPTHIEQYPYTTPYGILTAVSEKGTEKKEANTSLISAFSLIAKGEVSFDTKDLIEHSRLFDVEHVLQAWKNLINSLVLEGKKVAFVGMNDVLVPFANYLSEKEYRVVIFNGHDSERLNKIIHYHHKEYGFFGLNALFRFFDFQFSLPFYFTGLRRDLSKEKPDIIIVMDFIRFWFWQVVSYTKTHPETKVFLYAETKHAPQRFISQLLFPLFLGFLKRHSAFIEKIFVYTPEGKRFMEKNVPHAKVVLIPVGIDESLFHPKEGRVYAPGGVVRFLMNARFVTFKHHDNLLNALALFSSEEKKKLKVSLIGKEGETSAAVLERIRALQLEDVVSIVPMVSRRDLPELYSQHDVLILPSHNEAIGMVVPEAMACGLVTITSDTVGGNVYVKENETGYIFETGNIEELYQALRNCLNNTYLQEKGTVGARYIATHFTDTIQSTHFLAALQ